MRKLNVLIWNEYRDDRENPEALAIYPYGIHYSIAEGLVNDEELNVSVGILDEAHQGLPPEKLQKTDVLIWWAHHAHKELEPDKVELIVRRVKEGMGFLVLHSAHFSEPFIRLMNETCRLGAWEANASQEVIWTIQANHPIVKGVPNPLILPQTEMYGEPFEVPAPDQLIFISSFEDGNVFRSGCLWRRGKGRIFYFRPGHETYPIYNDESVRKVIHNAVRWLGGLPS